MVGWYKQNSNMLHVVGFVIYACFILYSVTKKKRVLWYDNIYLGA